MDKDITKKMLNTIHEGVEKNRHYTAEPIVDEEYKKKSNFLTEAKALMDNVVKKKINESASSVGEGKEFEIDKNTPQFGDVKSSQEETLKKTIEEDMEVKLVFYAKDTSSKSDLVLNGKIDALNIVFQFRYRDPSGDGCYIWANELQLTDTNARKIGKIRDAFLNWKTNLIQNGDLLEKLYKAATKK